jgi:hypothetical protein
MKDLVILHVTQSGAFVFQSVKIATVAICFYKLNKSRRESQTQSTIGNGARFMLWRLRRLLEEASGDIRSEYPERWA